MENFWAGFEKRAGARHVVQAAVGAVKRVGQAATGGGAGNLASRAQGVGNAIVEGAKTVGKSGKRAVTQALKPATKPSAAGVMNAQGVATKADPVAQALATRRSTNLMPTGATPGSGNVAYKRPLTPAAKPVVAPAAKPVVAPAAAPAAAPVAAAPAAAPAAAATPFHEHARNFIRENPLAVAGGAVGTGLVAGHLMTSKN